MSIRRDRTKVVILTGRYQIKGEIAHFQNARLTDYMVETKQFIAVTEAEVMDNQGHRILSAPFLNVGRDHIEIIAPVDELKWFNKG